MEKISYGGWDNCYRLANDQVELVVTADVGPRIIRFGFIGRENMFGEIEGQVGKTKADNWMIFGGHRLWHSPEAARTYYPDLEPVLVQEIENGMMVTQKPEPTTGIQKQMEITMKPDKPEVKVKHTLINHNVWPIEAAPWGLSVMDLNGTAIVPFPPRGKHPESMTPTSVLSIWPYTDLSDPRWGLGFRFVLLKQDPENTVPQKIGIFNSEGWAAYANHNALFVKQTPLQYDGIYPDLGVNFELFTNEMILEVESLGPLELIPPKGKVDHFEYWTLYDNVPQPKNDEDVEKFILPLLK
ncbi:MAG: hypothetical protein H0S79_01490 [Anaerolineaceae bacterium]|nr:hypothetical protein [Anaerolineaceae bacterium]